MSLLHRAATIAGAATLGLALAVATSAPALAAGAASIDSPGVLLANTDNPISGTCPEAALTAVVTITQGPSTIGQDSFPVTGTTWSGDVTVTGTDGTAAISLACLAYGSDAPVGTAVDSALVFDIPPFGEASVAVTPARVVLGHTATVSGACPEGSTAVSVYLAIGTNDPFAGAESVKLHADGTFSVKLKITRKPPAGADPPQPKPGPAFAVAVCENTTGAPTGLGQADFTITAGPTGAATADPVGPQLAATGPSGNTLVLTGFAAAFILVGAGLVLVARTTRRAHGPARAGAAPETATA